MNTPRGLPLLSGPPPDFVGSEPACRKCNKEFNILFARSKRCNHCGYSYCSSCAGYTALMPRENSGYDPTPVCAFCIDNLTTTAGSRSHLKSLSLGKLKKYADAYNLRSDQIIEKDELVDRLISYRRQNGCLPPENEDFYRRHSVPNLSTPRHRGLFSRQQPPAPTPGPRPRRPQANFPRPDVQSQWQPPLPRTPRPASTPQTQPQPQYSARPQPSQPPTNPSPRPQQPSLNVPQPNLSTRPRTTSHGATTAPPPPTLDQLLTMAPEDLRSLSVSVLKEILFHNHVNARLLIEKSDLVDRVTTFIADERRERERQEVFRQMEEEQDRLRRTEAEAEAHSERLGELHLTSEPQSPRQTPGVVPEPTPDTSLGQGPEDPNNTDQPILAADTEAVASSEQKSSANPPRPNPGLTSRPAMAISLERNGLCVICQDEEANIAIVDCGHMAMCRGCSDLIMGSTRECPLCRTRIVTEARLLRIFKA